MKNKLFFFCLIVIIISLNPLYAQENAAEVISSGGGRVESPGNYINYGVFGQPAAGVFSQSPYTNQVGFIYRSTPHGPPPEVWVNHDYCVTCPNDGYTWNYNAFDDLNLAIDAVEDDGIVHIAGDFYYSGDLTLGDGKLISLGDNDLFISGDILGADNNNYIVTDGDGKLIMTTASSQTWSIGTANLGLCPLVITAPSSNTFGVNLKDYTDESICMNFLSQCYWDIEHTAGSDAAQLDFVYLKTNVPNGLEDPTITSYVLHNTGGNSWRNITPGGATTVDNWDGDTDYYVTTATDVSDFSPFGPCAFPAIPTLTEWAAIVLGSLLLIFGAWFIWRRIT